MVPPGCSQVSDKSPSMAKGRPSASLTLALSQGLARFQSAWLSTAMAASGMAHTTAALARLIFWRRERGMARLVSGGQWKLVDATAKRLLPCLPTPYGALAHLAEINIIDCLPYVRHRTDSRGGAAYNVIHQTQDHIHHVLKEKKNDKPRSFDIPPDQAGRCLCRSAADGGLFQPENTGHGRCSCFARRRR